MDFVQLPKDILGRNETTEVEQVLHTINWPALRTETGSVSLAGLNERVVPSKPDIRITTREIGSHLL